MDCGLPKICLKKQLGNGQWGIEWSRDRWTFVIPICSPVSRKQSYVLFSNNCKLGTLDSLLWGSTVGYPSDSLASCILLLFTWPKLFCCLISFKVAEGAIDRPISWPSRARNRYSFYPFQCTQVLRYQVIWKSTMPRKTFVSVCSYCSLRTLAWLLSFSARRWPAAVRTFRVLWLALQEQVVVTSRADEDLPSLGPFERCQYGGQYAWAISRTQRQTQCTNTNNNK